MHGLIENYPHFSVNNLTDIFGISQVYLSSRMYIVSLDKKEEEAERATKLNMVKLT